MARTLSFMALALLMALGLYLRIPQDVSYHYLVDETMYVNIGKGDSLADVLRFSHYVLHPPLFFIFLHYWIMISSDTAFVRGLPLLLGGLLIPVYYFIGRRIGGELCGLCCAALIALSHGCIFQSYVLRGYCLFMLFTSLSFYCYVCWRESYRRSLLACYVLLGLLAAYTEFTALFYILCITLFQACAMILRRTERRALMEWLFANVSVALFALFICYLWQPAMKAHEFYFLLWYHHPATFGLMIINALHAAFNEADYIYPTFPLLVALLIYACQAVPNRSALRPYLFLTGFTCLLRMILYLAWLDPSPFGRHDVWMLPFIVPAAGGMAADLMGQKSKYILVIAALALFATFFEFKERFQDRSEVYGPPPNQWRELNEALSGLTSTDLVFIERDPSNFIINPYPYMGEDVFTGTRMATLAPYMNTHILFNPYYIQMFNREVLLATLEDARDRHMLDNIDRVVFLQLVGMTPPLVDLMFCRQLEKQIIALPPFPPFLPGHILTFQDLPDRFTLTFIAKQAILDDVLSPTGKARGCLDGKHDGIHGLIRVTYSP